MIDTDRLHSYLSSEHHAQSVMMDRLQSITKETGSVADTIESALRATREMLDVDVAFVSRFQESQLEFGSVDGDADSFGFSEGDCIPLDDTPCNLVASGEIPNVIPDMQENDLTRELGITEEAQIGLYVGFPLKSSRGRVYGTLCAMSHSPSPAIRVQSEKFMSILAQVISSQLEREELEQQAKTLQLRATGADALLSALEARDGYTGEHSQSVVELCVKVARYMGESEKFVTDLEQTALLHDIGKLGIADSILNKPSTLDKSEWKSMKTHTSIGESIVSTLGELSHLAPAIRSEHEKWDGTGYPDGLSGEEIPLASRIILACDAYDAMVSDRPYREAMSQDAALGELRKNAGTQFCPDSVDALLSVLNVA